MKKSISIVTLLFIVSIAFAQNKEIRKVDSFNRLSFRVPGKLYLRQGSPQKVEVEASRDVLEELDVDVDGNTLVIGRKGNGWLDFNWDWDNDDKVNVYITVPNIEGINVSGSGTVVSENKLTVGDLDLKVSGSGLLEITADASGEVEADVSGSGTIKLSGKCQSFDSDVSGSGRVKMEQTVARDATFGVSGSGRIEASGTATSVRATISGSGRVLAANLETDRCNVRISGSGGVEINVKSELDANISGSGSVSYKGNPSHVNSHASGSGHVRKM
jgi:hypothetical protein